MIRSPPTSSCAYRSKNAENLWHRIVLLCFLGCLFLFSRAFLSLGDPGGQLLLSGLKLPAKNPHGDRSYSNSDKAASVVELFQDQRISNWGPAKVVNSTTELEFADAPKLARGARQISSPNENRRVLSLLPTNVPSGLETAGRSQKALLLTPAVERIVAQCGTLVPGQNEYKVNFVHASTTRGEAQIFDGGYDPFDIGPVLSMEEFHDVGQSFAVKIWIIKGGLSRENLRRAEQCRASSGLQCLPDSHSPTRRGNFFGNTSPTLSSSLL
ncbi:hypothetical protein BDZ97DRAFT_1917011 [Flammula alnicola]|nr:hypothetical protein BDZ97DRAFT_1917011 [Flammula alnicola]